MEVTSFYRPDGPYSWLILVMVILNSLSTYGFMLANLGILSDIYQDLFQRDQAETNIISSVGVGVFLFSSKWITSPVKKIF